MIREELWEKVLVDPWKLGANQLYIVSGYASAAMVFHQYEETNTDENLLNLHLIIGMAGREGISLADHEGFRLLSDKHQGLFHCSYYTGKRPVHAKLFAWYCSDMPQTGFIGSANYSQNGFSDKQQEVMIPCEPKDVHEYYLELQQDSIICTDPQAESLIDIYVKEAVDGQLPLSMRESRAAYNLIDLKNNEHIQTTFLKKNGELPTTSGLNWGQREGRDPNQAYIPVRAPINSSKFFPPEKDIFTVITDDDHIFFCTRAQDKGKAIETPESNSILGRYFREKIGVPTGEPVKLADLQKYGRVDVDFYKIDNEKYFMDFSVRRIDGGK